MDDSYFEMDFAYRKTLSGHDETINSVEISPSGHFLCTAGDDTKILLTNIFSNDFKTKEIIKSSHTEPITSVKFKNETSLLTSSLDYSFGLYDLNRSCCIKLFRTNSRCTKIDYSIDFSNETFGISTTDNIQLFDERTPWAPVHSLDIHGAKMSFRPKNQYNFAVGSLRNNLSLYDLRQIKNPITRYKIEPNKHGISDCNFNKNGDLILVTEHSKCPSIYRTDQITKKAQCFANQTRNIVTYKSFKFGGPFDDYILGGFDDLSALYWKIKPSELFESNSISYQNTFSDSPLSLPEKNSPRNFFHIKKYKKLEGFKSVINQCIMHEKVPLIFCTGIENLVHCFSPFPLGENEESEPNYDSIQFTNSWVSTTYENTF